MRKVLSGLLTAWSIVFFATAFALLSLPRAIPTVSATESVIVVDEITTLKMKTGAAVRVIDGESLASENCGIRYSFTMDKDEYVSLMNNVGEDKTYSAVKFGMFIAAANYNINGKEIDDESHVSGDGAMYYWQVSEDGEGNPIFDKEVDTSTMKRIIRVEGSYMSTDSEDSGKMCFNGSVVGMLDDNLSRDYIGIGFIEYTESGTNHYKFAEQDDNQRSMEYVARKAYEVCPELQDSLKGLYLNKCVRVCSVSSAPVAVENLYYTEEAQNLINAGTSDGYSEMVYSLDNATWSNEIPTATEVGTYTVYYKAQSKTDFDTDSDVASLTVSIGISLGVATDVIAETSEGKIVGFKGTYDYMGLGEYSVGDVLEFKFHGRNIPNVGLFVNKNGVNPIGGGTENTGIFIQTSGHGAITYSKRLYITGPYLIDAGSIEAYSGITEFTYRSWLGANKELAVDVSYEVDGGRFSKFGIEMLDENADYIYRVSTVESATEGKVTIKAVLYSLDGDTPTLVSTFSKEITHYLDSLENRYAVAYGAGDYSDDTYAKHDTIIFNFEKNPVIEVMTLNSATIKETTDGNGNTLFSGTYDYMGLGEYSVGDVLEFKFHGKNIPNVGLFVNKNGVNPIGGGTENTGIFIQTSGHGAITYSKRLYITGPYLIDAGSIEAYSGITSFKYRSWLGANHELGVDTSYEVDGGKFSKFGIEMLDENTDYIYRVSTSASEVTGNVKIGVELYSVADETETLVSEYSKEVTHYLDSLENRYAVAYGMGDLSGKAITFGCVIKKAS